MNKMKKLAIATGCFLLLLVCSLYCSTNKAYAKEQTEFIVGFDAEFPPYGYLDENGDYIGFDLSLAEEVCKRNDWKLIKRPISWDSKDSVRTLLLKSLPISRERFWSYKAIRLHLLL